MVNLDDILHKDEDEYFEQSVKKTLSKPRVWDPENDGFYNDEKESSTKLVYKQTNKIYIIP